MKIFVVVASENSRGDPGAIPLEEFSATRRDLVARKGTPRKAAGPRSKRRSATRRRKAAGPKSR